MDNWANSFDFHLNALRIYCIYPHTVKHLVLCGKTIFCACISGYLVLIIPHAKNYGNQKNVSAKKEEKSKKTRFS